MTAKVELLTPSGGKVILDPTNTAVDRVLTLPAVAGTVFNQGNVVGAVSQSSGVPTGSIIERGSNSNGEFVKYADGTLICISAQQSVNLSGSVTREIPSYPVSPASGAPASVGICMDDVGTTVENTFSAAATVGVDARANNWNYAKNSTINSATTITMRLFLIGRWF